MQRRVGQSGGVPSSGDAHREAAEIVDQIVLRHSRMSEEQWHELIVRNREENASNLEMQAAFFQLAHSANDLDRKEVAIQLLSDCRLLVELSRAESGSTEL